MSKIDYNLASFNIRFDNASDNEDGWDFRKQHVLGMLNYYAWDVVGLQEVLANQLDYISTLSEYSFVGIGRDKDGTGESGPIFYKKDVFDKLDSGTFWLSLTPDQPSKSWGSDCNRMCTWVRLRDVRNEASFIFLNTHLDHVSEEARFMGAQLIIEWIEEHASDIPVILVGDFNAFRGERCYQEITKRLNDTRQEKNAIHYGPSGTFTDFDYNLAWHDMKEIDYVFTSRHISVVRTRTVVDSFDRKYPSDHFPIVATIAF